VLRTDRKNFTVLHGMDGFDELTFIGVTRILGKERDEILANSPLQSEIKLGNISGGNTVEASANILVNLLEGKGTKQQNTVLAGNVALAIQTFNPQKDFIKAFAEAHDAVLSGTAIHHLKKIVA
jgi:anthranilate phosphoribosyltransferase